MNALPAGATASNVRFVSRSDQGGRPDGVQVILHKGHAYIGHMFSDGYSRRRCARRDEPEDGRLRRRAEEHPLAPFADSAATSCSVVNGPNIWAMAAIRRARQITTRSRSIDAVQTEQPFGAGIRVFSMFPNRQQPREIAFLHMPGFGAHRIWWVGGRTPMSRCILKASSTTRWRSSMCRTRHGRSSPAAGGCPA